ncbi:hypothetical protein [Streptomyces olivaceoviridis]
MKRLEGKVALISGTARGQGRAAALRFAAEGALVVGGDLPHEEAVETRRLIAHEGGTALSPGPLDVGALLGGRGPSTPSAASTSSAPTPA